MSNTPNINSDVNSLINKFQQLSGFQRSNRFEVEITPPAKALETSPSIFNNFIFHASSVQIPSQVINYYQDSLSPGGPMYDVPMKREYDDRFIIDFIVDKTWKCRRFFDQWMEWIFKNHATGTGYKSSSITNYYDDITGTITIRALDTNNSLNKKIVLEKAWPSTILPTQMMHDNPNDYLTLSVDINYRYYTIYESDNVTKTNPPYTDTAS
jgi:hypothetical protein